MKELHSTIDQDGFGKIIDENNQYYQPIIKTTRKEKYPKRMFFENYEYIPKQPLIKFLEDKIKECDKNIDEFFSIYGKATVNNIQIKRKAFQEVLDFVNKGDKDE